MAGPIYWMFFYAYIWSTTEHVAHIHQGNVIFFCVLNRNNYRGAQRQVLLDTPVQLSQISADVGNEIVIYLLIWDGIRK